MAADRHSNQVRSGVTASREADEPGPESAASAREGITDRALRSSVRSGTIWMVSVTVFGRALTAASQLLLAFLLTREDFGIASAAIGAGALLQTFRDGGISKLLVQQGATEYPRLSGQFFYLALTFNLLVAALTVSSAPFLAGPLVYDEPEVRDLLWILALFAPLSTPSQILGAKLRIDLRFSTSAKIIAVTTIIHHGGAIVFALMGMGAMSFVLPYPLMALWRSAATFFATRDTPWLRGPDVRLWPHTLRRSAWIMLGTLATVLSNQGDFVILLALTSASVAGVYFFSYQVARQVIVLFASNVSSVLFPALARIAGEAERQKDLTVRIMSALGAASAPAAWGTIAIIGPLVKTLYAGRWDSAIAPIQVLSLAMPLLLMQHVPRTVLMSLGRFRLWSMLVLFDGLGLIAAASIGAALAGDDGPALLAGEGLDPLAIAVVVSLFSAAASLVISHLGLAPIGAGARTVLRSLWRPMLVGGGAAAIAIGLGEACFAEGDEISRLLWRAAFFGAATALLARRLTPEEARTLIGAAPMRLRKVLEAALRLRRGRLPSPGREMTAPSPLDAADRSFDAD